MKQLALAAVLLFCAFGNQPAKAQQFFYVPPGYGGYYYGIDVGNGVGFGYGLGVGIPVTPEMLMGSVTGPSWYPDQEWNPVQYPAWSAAQVNPIKPLPAKNLKLKKLKESKQAKDQKAAKTVNAH